MADQFSLTKPIIGLSLLFGAAVMAFNQDKEENKISEQMVPQCDEVIDVKRGSYREEPMDVLVCKNGTAQMAKPYKKGFLTEIMAIHAKKGTYKKKGVIFGAGHRQDIDKKGLIKESRFAGELLNIVKTGTSIPLGKALVQPF
jgi:hypothetical protein